MPCQSPPKQVPVASPIEPAFLSMSQQSQLNMAPNSTTINQQSQQQQGPPQLPGPPGQGGPTQGQGQAKKQSGPAVQARNGYNEKAMAEIRNSLRPFEQADQPFKSVNSNGVLSESMYRETIQTLMSMGLDEVRSILEYFEYGGLKLPLCFNYSTNLSKNQSIGLVA